ncbi:MAG: transcription termination/antitermination protein NusA [Dehalococcoidia bacterium]|nr:transcription termination/antitermination protein NusA [Dehalococcoidia bacterium]
MKSDFLLAVTQLANERHLPREMVLQAVEAALVSAYKKDSLIAGQDITVRLDPATAEINVYVLKQVVAEVADPKRELTLEEARRLKPAAQLADTIEIEAQLPSSAGRIAAQTAKQVVLQRLREAEREQVYAEFADKEGDILTGQVQRFESNHQVILDVGKVEAVLPASEQASSDHLRLHQRLRVYVMEVQRAPKGPLITVSRSHKNLLKRLMELEIPEIYNGVVEIKAIAREAGSRSKVAVVARQEGVDAVGSCVGMRGNRIQNIVKELQDERIDVIQWHKDPPIFIANALSPAQVLRVELNETNQEALVVVPDRHLSLAIGREGQNARLAAKLTGWKIDIKSTAEMEAERLRRLAEEPELVEEAQVAPKPIAQVVAPVAVLASLEAPVAAPTVPAAAPVAKVAPPVVREEAVAIPKASPAIQPFKPPLSPEEALALLTVEEELANKEQVEEEEEEAEVVEGEEIWDIPRITKAPSGIRFAEDILGPREPRGRGGRNDRRDDRARKGRKTGAGRAEGTPGRVAGTEQQE